MCTVSFFLGKKYWLVWVSMYVSVCIANIFKTKQCKDKPKTNKSDFLWYAEKTVEK